MTLRYITYDGAVGRLSWAVALAALETDHLRPEAQIAENFLGPPGGILRNLRPVPLYEYATGSIGPSRQSCLRRDASGVPVNSVGQDSRSATHREQNECLVGRIDCRHPVKVAATMAGVGPELALLPDGVDAGIEDRHHAPFRPEQIDGPR